MRQNRDRTEGKREEREGRAGGGSSGEVARWKDVEGVTYWKNEVGQGEAEP